jgi:hypothetical protein
LCRNFHILTHLIYAKFKGTTAIFIDKYHPKANGLCAISVRVTFERKKRYYALPISLTIPDFEKAGIWWKNSQKQWYRIKGFRYFQTGLLNYTSLFLKPLLF